MSVSLNAEQLRATKKALVYYQELLPLCHVEANIKTVQNQIKFLQSLLNKQ